MSDSGIVDIVAAGGGVLGAIAGGIAVIVAVKAYKVAEDGNDIAEAANDTAANAVRQAEEANRVAVEANDLAGDANAIAERALRVAQDDVPYNWTLQVDTDRGVVVVTNDCGHAADQLTVIIDVGGQPVADAGPEDVPAFGKLDFDVRGLIEQRLEDFRKEVRPPLINTGDIIVGRRAQSWSITFRAHLRWNTPQQVPRTDVVEEVVRYQKMPNGRIERRGAGRRTRD